MRPAPCGRFRASSEVATGGSVDGWEILKLSMAPGADPREAIYHLAAARRWTLRELSRRTPSLEQVFIDIIHADHR